MCVTSLAAAAAVVVVVGVVVGVDDVITMASELDLWICDLTSLED